MIYYTVHPNLHLESIALPGGVELSEVPSMYLGGALFYLLLPAKTQTL